MLFEKFINRYRNPIVNDIAFPSIALPILIIVGLCLLSLLPVLIFLGRDVFYNLPSLEYAFGTSGLGLIVGSVAVGSFWICVV